MPSPTSDQPLLTWVRLFDGRLWHVADQPDPEYTECGRRVDAAPDRYPELLDEAPPANGWTCGPCVRRLREKADSARQAWLQDPRRRPGDVLPAPDPDGPPEAESPANTIPADVTSPTSQQEA